jgi:hypothetical protein
MHAVVIFEVKTHGSAGKRKMIKTKKSAMSPDRSGSVKRRKWMMRKNSRGNKLMAKGKAHSGAESSWRDLTNLDHRQPNSSGG